MYPKSLLSRCAIVLALPLWISASFAQDLRIGTSSDISSIDPHFHSFGPNIGAAAHIFDTLLRLDDRLQIHLSLATSVRRVSDLEWEIALREGVKFHDGTPLTAEDVVFSLRRIPTIPNSPALFVTHTRAIKDIIVTGPLSFRILTNAPSPSLQNDLSKLAIVSKRLVEGRTTADFNSGAIAIGTGPYRFRSWIPAQALTLMRNLTYWGQEEPWERVVLRPISNEAARETALLAGDVDVIEAVPVTDIDMLSKNPNFSVFTGDSIRVIYLHMDTSRDQSPMVMDLDGKPLNRNPLKDWRVRQAINLAINRKALAERTLNGQATPIGQLVPSFIFGASSNLPPPPFDPERAIDLLKEAGWHGNFAIRLAAPTGRYPKDAQVAHAVAQMLTRVGITTAVELMPIGILNSRGSKLEFSLLMLGARADSGEAGMGLVQLLATHDVTRGTGANNRGRYSNPKLDAILAAASVTMENDKRAAMIAEAMELGMRDVGMVTLYVMQNSWAARKGIIVAPRVDDLNMAMSMRPEK